MTQITQEAMNAALGHFYAKGEHLKTQHASMWEAFLTGRVFQTTSVVTPSVSDSNRVVGELFTVDPTNPKGRLKPFRFGWGSPRETGRATVWNVTTRGKTTDASSLFHGGDIRRGIRADAIQLLTQTVPHLPAREALSVLLARDQSFADGAGWPEVHAAAWGILGLSQSDYEAITRDEPLGVQPLGDTRWTLDLVPDALKPVATQVVKAPPSVSRTQIGAEQPLVEMLIDPRLERMIRRAVARYPFILLVGPPGTGKGTLVRWIMQQVREDSESFGLPVDYDPDPLWKTPDESWSAFDLVGGQAPDKDGVLQWSPGAVLNAVAEDRWLVLDETNRADMDRIMGPLLTWLSGQSVEVGRGLGEAQDVVVTLGWNGDSSESLVKEQEHLAGKAWRLVGTYNPQDAQRVFRFGLALSRRFVVVPVPALEPSEFENLLQSAGAELPPDVTESISAMYSAHFDDPHTLLGPAVFLRIADYVLGGDDGASTDELVAEAYVLNLGKYLAAWDDSLLDGLGWRLVETEGALTQEQWAWIKNQRLTLG